MSKAILKNVIVEDCPFCGAHIIFFWIVDNDGHSIYCPHCGKRMMLCSVCPKAHDKNCRCDWNKSSDVICTWDDFLERHPEQIINQLTSLLNDIESFINGEKDHDEVFVKDISALKAAIHLLKERKK